MRWLDYLGYNTKGCFPFWAFGIRKAEEGHRYWSLADRAPVEGSRAGRCPAISWEVGAQGGRLPHADHLEMSGRKVSVILSYGVDPRGGLRLRRHVVWPGLRTWPDDTHASLHWNLGVEAMPRIKVGGRSLGPIKPSSFAFDGRLRFESTPARGLFLSFRAFPSPREAAYLELWEFRNDSGSRIDLDIDWKGVEAVKRNRGGARLSYRLSSRVEGGGHVELGAGESRILVHVVSAAPEGSALPEPDGAEEESARLSLVSALSSKLVLETGDRELDTAFAFAKLRTSESIFETSGGLMHSPGGASFYAALWTNDECEYANPYFAYSGYGPGIEAALNCYRLYGGLMDSDLEKPLPTSIIAEGRGLWQGAGDRGDAAMYAAGSARFLLASGDRALALELWPRLVWCLDFCESRRDEGGPVLTDSDELEGRLPSGKANLSTQALYYDALGSAASLARDLGLAVEAEAYKERAGEVAAMIEAFFGAEVEGYETYRYYEGCEVLRSWACLPAAFGLADRASGTLDALFGPKMWTEHGLRSISTKPGFWDRSTLFALRAAFVSGDTERALERLKTYTSERLLGAHVPYPVEAHPEGNRRHLAAESALYCRVLVEGLWGFRPTGLDSFELSPRLPASWEGMALRGIEASGARFDLEVSRVADGALRVLLRPEGGEVREVRLGEGSATARFELP